MNFSNSFSSIISSVQVCTCSLVSSFSVMAAEGVAPVNLEVTAPSYCDYSAWRGTSEPAPVVDDVAVMEVELQSLRAVCRRQLS